MSKISCIVKYGLLTLMLLLTFGAAAQTTIVPTGQTTQMNGKKYYYHVVEEGQSVFSIARAYGLHYSAAILRTDLQHVNAHDTVWLPINDQSRAAVQRAIGATEATAKTTADNAATQTVKVENGMTLFGLTKTYKTTAQELYKLNPGLEENGLKTGQTLVVPRVNAPAAATAKTTTAKTPAVKTSTDKTSTDKTPAAKTPAAKTSAAKTDNDSSNAAGTTTKKPQGSQKEGLYHYQTPAKTSEAKPAKVNKAPAAEKPAPTPLSIRSRINPETLYMTVMIPLYLDKIDEISTTKFDVDQRGKKDYKSFEFIQFYEGLQMAMEELESHGVSVRLNVVDVQDENENTIRQAYTSHNVAQSDLIIALLQRKGFEVVAELAKNDKVFTVNPLSTRSEILQGNPYVVKYMPSEEGRAKALVGAIHTQYSGSPVLVVSSGAKEEAEDKAIWEKELKENKINYTLVDWTRQQNKLASMCGGGHQAVVVSLYDRGKEKNRIQTNLLMNRMNSLKSNTPVLMTMNNLVRDMGDVDFNQLQNCSYHFVYPAYLDYNNTTHKAFIEEFKDKYKTEPMGEFAGAAYDIMLYFGTALNQSGSDFWKNLKVTQPSNMLFPLRLQQSGEGNGFENQAGQVYEMIDFQLKAVPMQ